MTSVLCVVQLPPPVHGVSVMNTISVEVLRQFGDVSCTVVPIGTSVNNRDVSALSVRKLWLTGRFFVRYAVALCRFPQVVYFPFSPVGLNAYRDVLVVGMARCVGAQLVLHLHGTNIQRLIVRQPCWRPILRWVFRGAAVITQSLRLKEDISGVYDGDPCIIPNTIAAESGLMPTCKKNRERASLLFFSNLQKEKGVLTFIAMLAELARRGLSFDAVIAGSPYILRVEDVQRVVEQYGLSGRVRVTGPLYGQDKARTFSGADVFVLPSENEAFPLVVLEALASGLPVVASSVGAIRDIVRDGVNGFVIDDDDSNAYADKIQLLLTDSRLREEMGARSRKIFEENFTREIFEKNLGKVFESVLAAGH